MHQVQYSLQISFRQRLYVKSVRIESYSGPHFPAFGLNTERFRIQSECGKLRTRIAPNTDTLWAVVLLCSVRP